MKLACAGAVLLALVFAARAAPAEPASAAAPPSSVEPVRASPALVVLLADEPGDAVSARLQRDLLSLGFSVLLLRATPENASDESALGRTARGLGAIASLRVLADARGSELWLSEPTSGDTLTRSLIRSGGAPADPNEVALGTLELLRASMLELHPPSRSLPASSPAPAVSRERAAPTASASLSLSGAFALELGLRSVGPSWSSLWAAWVRLGGCFGLRGFAALPLLPERDDIAEGRVEVEPLLLGAGLSCSLASHDALLWPRVSLGFAGGRIVTRGTALDPTRSSQGTVWLAGGYGLLGLGLRVARDVRLNLDATGVLFPRPAVILADGREVGTWGAPGGLLSLGLEVLADL